MIVENVCGGFVYKSSLSVAANPPNGGFSQLRALEVLTKMNGEGIAGENPLSQYVERTAKHNSQFIPMLMATNLLPECLNGGCCSSSTAGLCHNQCPSTSATANSCSSTSSSSATRSSPCPCSSASPTSCRLYYRSHVDVISR